jgi:hypothetical protein
MQLFQLVRLRIYTEDFLYTNMLYVDRNCFLQSWGWVSLLTVNKYHALLTSKGKASSWIICSASTTSVTISWLSPPDVITWKNQHLIWNCYHIRYNFEEIKSVSSCPNSNLPYFSEFHNFTLTTEQLAIRDTEVIHNICGWVCPLQATIQISDFIFQYTEVH